MGGNALKNTTTRRYHAAEYFTITKEIISRLNECLWIDRAILIPAYSEKETFGDADIIYSTFSEETFTVEDIMALFKPNEIVKNGSVISFDYKEFQIDLIHSKTNEFDYGLSYFSYNDVGNLIGKLAHRHGLKHGHTGLYLPIRCADNMFANICLTRDYNQTLEFLDLNVDTFAAGFANLTEIFDFIAASSNYSPEFYKLEHLNAIARIRDKKRDTYRKFLEYGERYTGMQAEKITDKSQCLKNIFAAFPDAFSEYSQEIKNYTVKKVVCEKFNGNLVSKWTNLKDKELGMFMKKLKNNFYYSDTMLAYLTPEQIYTRTIDLYMENYGHMLKPGKHKFIFNSDLHIVKTTV